MTPDTFSFFDVLEERTYPKDVVTVYLDEAAAYDFNKLSMEIDMMPQEDATPEVIAEFQDRAQKLQDRLRKSKYTFYLTGVSDDRVEQASVVANEQFEDKKLQRYTATKTIEKYLPESEQMNYVKFFNAIVLSLHIEQIVQHKDGRVMTAPDPEQVLAFMEKAPEAAKKLVNDKISGLRVRANAYEAALDEGFFPKS